MRDHRTIPGSSVANWSYYHDGQTTAEDEQILTGNLTVTRYGLGARGIGECERQTGTVSGGQHNLTSSTSVWYPVYDGHGNQCGTLSRATNNTYTLANVRTFDAWGNVRRGAGTGDPASPYCGSLGHVQDDESGLLYMRARFYDSVTGRFLSEDPNQKHQNWCVYCANQPVTLNDASGRDYGEGNFWFGAGLGFALLACALCACKGPGAQIGAIAAAAMAVVCFAISLDCCSCVTGQYGTYGAHILSLLTGCFATLIGAISMMTTAASAGLETQACIAVAACLAYSLAVAGALLDQDIDEGNPAGIPLGD
jgi:RHS repeat-associated protein